MASTADTQLNVWYCKRCRKSCKVQPPLQDPACKCANPVPGLHPTLVTLLAATQNEPKRRRLQALTDEEARLRSLVRKKQRVRITYEAEVVEAWTRSDQDGIKHVQFMVVTPDGQRHAVDPQLAGVQVEGLPAIQAES